MSDPIHPTIDHFETVAPDRIQRMQVDGRDVFAFTVKPGDVQSWDVNNIGPGGKPNQRAEISYAAPANADKVKSPYDVTDKTGPRSYDISVKFADGWPTTQRWATLLQFHAEDGTSGAGFGGIAVHGSFMDFGLPGHQNDDVFITRIPISTGRWYDIRLDINWSSGPSGYVKIFNAGVLVGEYHGQTVPAGSYKYLKQGYYRDGAIDAPGTVYETPLLITDGAVPVVVPPPVVLPPAPPAPPVVPPVVAPPVAAPPVTGPGLKLLIDELPVIELQVEGLNAQIGALNSLLTALQIRRAKVKACLDRGPKWNDPS